MGTAGYLISSSFRARHCFRVQKLADPASLEPGQSTSKTGRELSYRRSRNNQQERVMKAYLGQLSPLALVGLSIPALILVHTLWSVAVPAIIRVVVPETVRIVLQTL